MQLAVGFSIAS